jgi:ABC-type nitrate/sulfonate/bicarbonate transport system permease component
MIKPWLKRSKTIRDAPSSLESYLLGGCFVLASVFVWYLLTRGPNGERILDSYTLPSIAEVLRSFPSLWYERELSLSIVTSLARVLSGFVIAAIIGVPLGIIGGTYLRVNAFLKPIVIFGRTIPIAALIPLTMIWFQIGELQKIMFIFLASVAFVIFDSGNSVRAVPDRFLETSYTLGARTNYKKGAILASFAALIYGIIFLLAWAYLVNPDKIDIATRLKNAGPWFALLAGAFTGFLLWFPILAQQTLRKVIAPLALPDIVNSLRLIFGLAFGYIMLAEVLNAGRGLGAIINTSQRVGPREHIYLVLIIISLLSWGIDRMILRLQKHLFPYLKEINT